MACAAPFLPDALYAEVTRAAPYAALTRRDFDDVVRFVEDGGYALAAYDRFRKLFRDAEGYLHIRGKMVAAQLRDAALPMARLKTGTPPRLDGRTIAAQVLLYCGPTAYTWKIAFDGEFARYSPGVLVVDKMTEQLFSATDVQAIESCSAQDSFMAQIWTGRKTMVDMVVDVSPTRSLVFGMEAARQYGYERLRDLRDWLRAMSALHAKRRLAPTP